MVAVALARAALVALLALAACAPGGTGPPRAGSTVQRVEPGRSIGLPAYSSSVHRVPARAVGSLAGCPVTRADLRLLRVTRLGFDGRAHPGELVVRAQYAADVVTVFGRLYAARWPVARMRPVVAYAGDDGRSMAADNTSGFSCRTVAGTDRWSDHAYGAAIDLNPGRNPDLTSGRVRPPSARRFAALDRSPHAPVPPGVIRAGDVVVRAFAEIGWRWGGDWSPPDHQHFAAPLR